MPEEGPSCWAPHPPVCPVCAAAAEIESQSFLPPNGTGWNPRSVTEGYTVMIMCSLSFPELCISNTSTQGEPENLNELCWSHGVACTWERRKPSDESNAFMLAYSPVSRITEDHRTPEQVRFYGLFFPFFFFSIQHYSFDFNQVNDAFKAAVSSQLFIYCPSE